MYSSDVSLSPMRSACKQVWHCTKGMQTKYMDVSWGLSRVTCQLAPGITCPDTANFSVLSTLNEPSVSLRSPQDPLLTPALQKAPTSLPG